ncbi:MAG: PIN domain-containing protein [Candidatus Rokubacteria bacterium]|nr:PIN domain-containing protein [Candidatus Rokubacteria bacterium]
MSDRVFVDTNVLVYAHDLDAGEKRTVAGRRLGELWDARSGVLSTQVLQEFYVTVTRKIATPVEPAHARELVRTYAVWDLELLGPDAIVRASEIGERHGISFWDALVVAAAIRGRARKILSEDLNPGQTIEGVLVENPFAPAPA